MEKLIDLNESMIFRPAWCQPDARDCGAQKCIFIVESLSAFGMMCRVKVHELESCLSRVVFPKTGQDNTTRSGVQVYILKSNASPIYLVGNDLCTSL